MTGPELRIIRRQLRIPLRELAQYSDLSVGHLSQLERGLVIPEQAEHQICVALLLLQGQRALDLIEATHKIIASRQSAVA
jgi:transcriptional regulator with XRE-family HTH domain